MKRKRLLAVCIGILIAVGICSLICDDGDVYYMRTNIAYYLDGPDVGEVWLFAGCVGNPFAVSDSTLFEILEVKDGWVQFAYRGGTVDGVVYELRERDFSVMERIGENK